MKIRSVLAFMICVFVVTPLLADPPAQSGVVVRGESDEWAWWYIDFKRGFVAYHGFDIESLCVGIPVSSWWDYQANLPPAGEECLVIPEGEFCVTHGLVKGDDVITSVWPLSNWPPGPPYFPCDGIFGDPIAEGESDVMVNDNDWWGVSEHRANAVKLSAHGVLTDPQDSEMMIFNGQIHCVFTDDNWHCKTKIVLN